MITKIASSLASYHCTHNEYSTASIAHYLYHMKSIIEEKVNQHYQNSFPTRVIIRNKWFSRSNTYPIEDNYEYKKPRFHNELEESSETEEDPLTPIQMNYEYFYGLPFHVLEPLIQVSKTTKVNLKKISNLFKLLCRKIIILRLYRTGQFKKLQTQYPKWFTYKSQIMKDFHKTDEKTLSKRTLIIKVKQDCEEKCSICFEPIVKGFVVKKHSCGKMFHRKCLWKWEMKSDTCPMCRGKNLCFFNEFKRKQFIKEMEQPEGRLRIRSLDALDEIVRILREHR